MHRQVKSLQHQLSAQHAQAAKASGHSHGAVDKASDGKEKLEKEVKQLQQQLARERDKAEARQKRATRVEEKRNKHISEKELLEQQVKALQHKLAAEQAKHGDEDKAQGKDAGKKDKGKFDDIAIKAIKEHSNTGDDDMFGQKAWQAKQQAKQQAKRQAKQQAKPEQVKVASVSAAGSSSGQVPAAPATDAGKARDKAKVRAARVNASKRAGAGSAKALDSQHSKDEHEIAKLQHTLADKQIRLLREKVAKLEKQVRNKSGAQGGAAKAGAGGGHDGSGKGSLGGSVTPEYDRSASKVQPL